MFPPWRRRVRVTPPSEPPHHDVGEHWQTKVLVRSGFLSRYAPSLLDNLITRSRALGKGKTL